jgi:autotransporter-associated beta strand protein
VPRSHLRLVLPVAALALLAPPAAAQYTWDGNGGNGADPAWSDPANWVGSVVPVSGSTTTITFAGTKNPATQQTIASPFTLNQLTFDPTAGSFGVSGLGLNFVGNGSTLPAITQNSASGDLVNVPVTLTNNLTVGGTGTGAVQLGGPVTGTGSLTKAGTFTLILSGAGSTYSGGTFVNAGTLQLGASNVLGSTGAVTVGGGTFDLNGYNQTVGSLSLNSAAGSARPTVTTGAGTLTLGGNVTMNGGGGTTGTGGGPGGQIGGKLDLGGATRAFTITGFSGEYFDLVVSAAIGGTGGLTYNGLYSGNGYSNLALNGANTYTGPTAVNGAALYATAANALPATTAVNLASSTSILSLTTNQTANGVVAGSYSQTIGSLSGVAFSAVYLGSATLTVGGDNTSTTFAGNIYGSGSGSGTLVKTGGGLLTLSGTGNTANIQVNGGGVRVDSVTGGASVFGALGSGTLTLNNAFLVYGGPTASVSKPIGLTNTGFIQTLNAATTLTLTAPFTSTPGAMLEVYGPGTLELKAANSYTGGTLFWNGTVLAAADNVLGDPGGMLNFYNGTLRFTAAFNPAVTRPIYADSSTGGFDTNGFSVTVAQTISNSGTLNKYGAGTLTLSATENIYSGGTVVHGGTLQLGAGTAMPAGRDVTVLGGAVFSTNGLANTQATAIGTLALNGGGTLRVPSGSNPYYLNRLTTDAAGGTVDMTGTTTAASGVGAGLVFVGTGAGITVSGNSTWTGPNTGSAYIYNGSGGELPIVIAPGVTLTCGLSLGSPQPASNSSTPIRVTGGGTLYLTNPIGYYAAVRVNQAVLRMDNLGGSFFAPGSFDVTLDNGTLRYGGSDPTPSAVGFTLGPPGGRWRCSTRGRR